MTANRPGRIIAAVSWENLKGKFIVLDGPDGCGKSTQIKRLAELIGPGGLQTCLLRDPGTTRIGEQIRNLLLHNAHTEMSVRCEALLYMASRAQLYAERIEPALQAQQCVVCDRWLSSTYAYQAVAGRLGPEHVLQIAQAALERVWPDLTIILDLPADVALQRIGVAPDRMENKPLDYHQRVHRAFLELAQGRPDFRIVDAAGSADQVAQRVAEVITAYVNS